MTYVRENPYSGNPLEWYIEEARNNTEKLIEKTEISSPIYSELLEIVNNIQSVRSIVRRGNDAE